MKAFELYYSDRKCVRGRTTKDWINAPSQNVQAVIYIHDDGAQEVIYGFNEYRLIDDGTIIGTNVPLSGFAKWGSLMPDEKFSHFIENLRERSLLWDNPDP